MINIRGVFAVCIILCLTTSCSLFKSNRCVPLIPGKAANSHHKKVQFKKRYLKFNFKRRFKVTRCSRF